jgi:hypothetical protein
MSLEEILEAHEVALAKLEKLMSEIEALMEEENE